MNKKILLAGAFGTGVLALGALVPIAVFAQTATTTDPGTSFVQKLAEKLGIDVTTVQTAVDSTHDEMRAAEQAAQASKIADAVTAGTLTQRQADILNAIQAAMEVSKPAEGTQPVKEDFSGLTETERQAKMEEFRTEMDQKIVDALNTNGLNTTVEEFQSTQEAAKTAGVGFGFGVRHGGGPGFGMGGPR